MECAWFVASSGPDEESRVDLVTRVLDVKSAEIRKRLQDAEVKLARLRQSVPPDSSSKSWFRCRQGAQQIVDESLHDLSEVAERLSHVLAFPSTVHLV